MPVSNTTEQPRPGSARDHRAGSRGQALVEVALVVPVLLLILVAAGDLARVFSAEVSLESAARAGALEASLHPTSFNAGQPCDSISNRVTCAVLTESAGSSIAITSTDITLECDPSPCSEGLGNMVHVSVTGRMNLITPLLAVFTGGQSFDVTASASAQIAVRPNIVSGSTPSPTPTPDPSSSPAPTPTPTPTPSPTPFCIPPTADFSVSPNSGKQKKTDFQFTDMSTTTALCPLTWSWNFGDGAGNSSSSTLQNPVHAYQAKGVYTVTLVVSNFGGSATKVRTVTVTP